MDQTAWEVWQAGQKDPAYRLLLEQMTALEERFEAVMGSQDQEMQDAVCDYVMQCEAMSWRMLEFACDYLKRTD